MPNSELMPIGVFARRSGLTSSALRFYADAGLLSPAEVDPASGYRYYSADQVARATLLRGLREIGMPLSTVRTVLDAAPADASRLIDEHVASLLADTAAARLTATAIQGALVAGPGLPLATLKGPVLADAVEQVLTATAHDVTLPVLGGLRVEVTREAITLTATDRYRLSTRTLVPAEPAGTVWAATVDGDDLRAAVAELRRSAVVRLEATPHGLRLRGTGQAGRHCRVLAEEFPDIGLMLDSLDEVTSRVAVSKDVFLRALERHPGDQVTLRATDRGLAVLAADGTSRDAGLPARVTGQDLRVSFELTTLYPAVSTAVGPDLLIDLRGCAQPATIRSADRGDLTTWAMPVRTDCSG
ncbi:DNA polymerase III subunit beta family protein [Streptomyces sp. NPDC003362]